MSGLEVYDIFTTSLSLSWDVPTNTSNINGYYIYLENDNHMVNTTTYDIINETTVEGLEPYSSYRACIVPLVLTGNGTENCVDVQTAEGGELGRYIVTNLCIPYLGNCTWLWLFAMFVGYIAILTLPHYCYAFFNHML